MYPNLNAEMARRNIKPKNIAELFDMEVTSVYSILQGKRKLSVGRAWEIKKAFFPDLPIDYLFAEDGEEAAR